MNPFSSFHMISEVGSQVRGNAITHATIVEAGTGETLHNQLQLYCMLI